MKMTGKERFIEELKKTGRAATDSSMVIMPGFR